MVQAKIGLLYHVSEVEGQAKCTGQWYLRREGLSKAQHSFQW